MKRGWHYVYLARTADGSYYCGYALDPSRRLALHNAGKGSKSLRGRRPVKLAFMRRFATKGDALRFEIALKKRPHSVKRALSSRWLKKSTRSRSRA